MDHPYQKNISLLVDTLTLDPRVKVDYPLGMDTRTALITSDPLKLTSANTIECIFRNFYDLFGKEPLSEAT